MNWMLIEMIEEDTIKKIGMELSLKQSILDTGAANVWLKNNNSFQSLENVPPKSISIFVEGGELELIYNAINNSLPIGIESNGDVDIQGIKFFWVTDISYTDQKAMVDKLNRKLLKEELRRQLVELGDGDE